MKLGFATAISLQRMKDLVDHGDRLPIGYEFAPAVDWLRVLLARGHEVVVYTTAKDVDGPTTFRGAGLTVHIAKLRPRGTGKDFFAPERRQLVQMMRDDRCDVIHAHWTYEFALAALASGVPTLVTVHDLPWNVLRFFRDKFRVAKLLMAYAVALRGRYFSAVSDDAARHFQGYFCPWNQVEVISNGLPDAAFKLQPEPGERGGQIFGTILRGWSERKNGRVALEAFARLRGLLPNSRLIMFGKDYEADGPAWTWASQQGLTEDVVFVGELPYGDLLRRLDREIDILVHPSLDESFSMAALEAMAVRKPVIAGVKTPGVREVLAYGEAGVLVDVTDPCAVAEAMGRLATDRAYREKIADLGFERAYSTYRNEAIFDKYEKLYARVLAGA